MHTAKCPAKVLRFMVVIQVAFPLDFLFPDPMRLIPMKLREPYASGHEANARDSLHFTPSAFPVASAQAPEVANSLSCRDRLDNGNLADDLEVHLGILPLRRRWPRYSAWIFARCTMSCMRFKPSRVHCVTVAGFEPIGSRPCAISFSRTSGEFTAFTISAFSRSTIALGVASGSTNDAQVRHSNPGTPASATVGTSGNSGERTALGTPSARMRPSLM